MTIRDPISTPTTTGGLPFDATQMQFTALGTGAVARTVQDRLRDTVHSADYSGASVTAQINAAIAALPATGGVVIIPATMGAGEPTGPIATKVGILDFRATNAALSGAKMAFNVADANGFSRVLIVDDQTSPTLSNAAFIGNHRPTGTIPSNRTGDGIQGIGSSIGALLNSPTGYVLSGVEASVAIASTGFTLSDAWALHANATATGSTNVTNLVSAWLQAPTNTGSGTVTNAYGLVVEAVTGVGTTNNFSIWSKGNNRLDGTLGVNGLITVTVGAGNTASFFSGGAANFAYFDIGRVTADVRFGVAGAANDFISGSAQGDALIFTTAAKKLFLGANNGIALTIDSLVNVVPGTGALATGANSGFLYLQSCAGTPTGTPTTFTGRVPFVFDSTNNIIYINNAGTWKKTAALT